MGALPQLLIFSVLGAYTGYWALTTCKKIEVGGAYCSTYESVWYMACTLVQAHVLVSVLAKAHQWTTGIEREVLGIQEIYQVDGRLPYHHMYMY